MIIRAFLHLMILTFLITEVIQDFLIFQFHFEKFLVKLFESFIMIRIFVL